VSFEWDGWRCWRAFSLTLCVWVGLSGQEVVLCHTLLTSWLLLTPHLRSLLLSTVNLPGTFYTIDGTSGEVGASVCPVNTYGPGFRKQRACVPCPTNYKTNGLTGRTSPMQCGRCWQ